MSKKIVAIGGGLNGRIKEDGTCEPYETGPMDQEIIKITGKEKPNFLFLAHAYSTEYAQNKYFETMEKIYKGKYNCECKHLKSKELLDTDKVSELIDWADIIYEGGGNTLDMIALWKETEFDKVLRMAWKNGKVMCGVSAGANAWFKECSSDSLQIKYGKDQPLIGVDCIGLVDGLFIPHCDEPGRSNNVKELLKTSSEIGLSISNCCALEIIDNEYRLITSTPIEYDIKPYGLKTYWENGEYITEQIDDSLEFKPLSELSSRNNKNNNYKIVTICGSMKFEDKMREVAKELEIKNKYVVIQCIYGDYKFSEDEQKTLTELHYNKIKISDAIYVVNVNGYIGNQTRKEIEYAKKIGKEVMYLEPIK